MKAKFEKECRSVQKLKEDDTLRKWVAKNKKKVSANPDNHAANLNNPGANLDNPGTNPDNPGANSLFQMLLASIKIKHSTPLSHVNRHYIEVFQEQKYIYQKAFIKKPK